LLIYSTDAAAVFLFLSFLFLFASFLLLLFLLFELKFAFLGDFLEVHFYFFADEILQWNSLDVLVHLEAFK